MTKKLKELKNRATPAAPTTDDTVEARLKKLQDIYNKGLITKEEFEAKKAEILKAM